VNGSGPRTPMRTNVTHPTFVNKKEEFDTNDVDDQSYEDDKSDWYRHPPRRVKGKRSHSKSEGYDIGERQGGSHIAGVSEWPRHTPTTRDYHNQEDAMSVINSVANSEGSRSLDAIMRDRGVIVAEQEIERMKDMIACGDQIRKLALKEYDATTGVSKRSPNTSRASPMRSGDKSSAYDKQCSSQQDSPERDTVLRPDLADIVEDDEERIFPANDASNEQIYFSPRGTSLGGSPMFLSPPQHELAINKFCVDDERALIQDKKRGPL
jgi:hypothetical protein